MKGVRWTESQEQTLADMWADGKSLGIIAGALGFSRSAVGGKMGRLRLCQRKTAERVRREYPPRPKKPKRMNPVSTARPRPSAPILRALPDVAYVEPLVILDHLGPINDGPGPVELLKLRPAHCRTPLWGNGKPATLAGYLFCGEPVAHGSYCATCAPKMSYVVGPRVGMKPLRRA